MKQSTSEATFIPYVPETSSDNGTDLIEDSFAKPIVKALLRKYWNLDFAKATISGYVGTPNAKLEVKFWVGNAIVREATVESSITGKINVMISDLSALGTDIESLVCGEWLTRLGYEADLPCAVELSIGRKGELKLEVSPCF